MEAMFPRLWPESSGLIELYTDYLTCLLKYSCLGIPSEHKDRPLKQEEEKVNGALKWNPVHLLTSPGFIIN